MASLKVEVSTIFSLLETMGLMKLSRLSGEYLDLSSWCSSVVSKLAVSGRMDLAADMVTDVKIEMIPNTFGMTFFLLLFTLNYFASP